MESYRLGGCVVSMALVALLLTTLLGCATAPPAGDADRAAPVIEVVPLAKGAPAPWAGDLYSQDASLEVNAALRDLDECEAKASARHWWDKPLAGAKGFILGLVVGYIAALE